MSAMTSGSRAVALMLVVLALVACAGSTRAVFIPSDSSFKPSPGASPALYLDDDIDDVPNAPMRSVGVIEVRINSGDESRSAELAITKGREIGCWILVERSAFERLRERARLEHGAIVILAHGPGPHIAGAPRPKVTTVFHCIVPIAARAQEAVQA